MFKDEDGRRATELARGHDGVVVVDVSQPLEPQTGQQAVADATLVQESRGSENILEATV